MTGEGVKLVARRAGAGPAFDAIPGGFIWWTFRGPQRCPCNVLPVLDPDAGGPTGNVHCHDEDEVTCTVARVDALGDLDAHFVEIDPLEGDGPVLYVTHSVAPNFNLVVGMNIDDTTASFMGVPDWTELDDVGENKKLRWTRNKPTSPMTLTTWQNEMHAFWDLAFFDQTLSSLITYRRHPGR